MARRSTTVDEDAERLREEVGEGLSAPLEGTARLLEAAARMGFEATTWPLRALPRGLREGVGQSLRAGVAASALIPHALGRAVRRAVDGLLDDSGED